MAYSEKVLEHFNNPRNVGILDVDDKNVGIALIGAPECGDVLQLHIRIEKQQGIEIIKDVKFKAFGCGSAIASSSLATEMLIGLSIDQALQDVSQQRLANELSLPPVKIHCSVLVHEALQEAIKNYQTKQNG